MKALLLAATSSLALTGFAMAQTGVETGTPGGAATPPAAGSAATDSSSNASTGGAGAGTVENASPAAGGADGAGSTAAGAGTGGDAASGTATSGGATSAGGASGSATDTGGTTGGTMGATGTASTSTGTTSGDTAGGAGSSGAGSMATTTTTESATVTTTTADAGAAAMPADHPGMLGSWIMNRRIWTTNQPSSTEWSTTTLTERPAEWSDIAKVDDIVIDAQGNITGYVADIGGFLGLGAKQVLLDKDALHFVQTADDAFFATNFTREELEALPDFDNTTVMR